METIDWFLAPITLMLIYLLASVYINISTKDETLKKYFFYAVHFKMLGALGVTLVYFIYYGGAGDTVFYWRKASYIHKLIGQYGFEGLKLLFPYAYENDPIVSENAYWIGASVKEYFMVVRWATIFGFFNFKSYLEIAFLFSFMSLTGLWALYLVFYEQFPEKHKHLAWAILFVPSMIFWGSGIFKDTMIIGCAGWMVRCTYMIFIKRKRIVVNALILTPAISIGYLVKGYVVLSLMPLLLVWVILYYRNSIKNDLVRRAITPFLIGFSIIGGVVLMNQISAMGGRFNLENMEQRATDMVWWHTYGVEVYGEHGSGSHYSLGSPDFSLTGIIKKFPLAVNVTLFRPYLWEAGNPVMFASAIESLFFLFFTIRVFRKVKFKFFRLLFKDPLILISFFYSILFALSVGLTSYNFGALVRYKIPCLSFYLVTLVMVEHFYDKQIELKNMKLADA